MYAVGQKLWFVPNRGYLGAPREVTIAKVGRKWLTLSNGHRAKVDGLALDGGRYSSLGVCYLTPEEWEAKNALANAWDEFYSDISGMRRPPAGVSVQDICDARAILGFKD